MCSFSTKALGKKMKGGAGLGVSHKLLKKVTFFLLTHLCLLIN